MKIWIGHGSEHSYNLVLVGTFVDETAARTVEQKYERLRQIATDELPDTGWEDNDDRFSEELLDRLREMNLWSLSRSEVDGFAYHDAMRRNGTRVSVTTEDAEVQGLIKLLIDHGAKVELYSAHNWTDAGEPRGAEDE